jgi:hypothetical protein
VPTPGDLPRVPGYEVEAVLDYGGMGVVYRATDCTLGREVAVKVLLDRLAADTASVRRFAEEARITAQLQHPAIPPVHDLGTLPDGRPFLAMKLIKGQTLDAQMASRPEPSVERGRFVAVFEQLCQAVAYAHAQALEEMEGASFHRQSFERADKLQKALAAASCTAELDDWARTLDIAPILNDETYQRMVFCPGLGCFKAWRKGAPLKEGCGMAGLEETLDDAGTLGGNANQMFTSVGSAISVSSS